MRRPEHVLPLRERVRSESGVTLIMVAIAILVLTGFLVFVVDYGLMWYTRTQAQAAADAGALSGAVALAFDDTTYPFPAGGVVEESATVAAQENEVFNLDPGVVVSPQCPLFAAGAHCVQVDVHRDGTNGSTALPTIFGVIFGQTTQPVRATATAWVNSANQTLCMRPFSVADNWLDVVNPEYDPRRFERWNKVGPNAVERDPKDVYTPSVVETEGTGYKVSTDLGARVFLKRGNPAQTADTVEPGWSLPVRLPDGSGDYVSGASDFSTAIKYCIGNPVKIGDYLPLENGVMQGPTAQGTETDADSLVNQDPDAEWNEETQSVEGSCAPACAPFSPRIVPISVFDVDEYQWRTTANDWTTEWIPGEGPGTGSFSCPIGGRCVRVTNIIGFFVERMDGSDVMGRVVLYPGDFVIGPPSVNPGASFLKVIQLIR